MLLDTNNYLIAAALFPRLIGLIYFFVFGSFLFQMKGLFGQEGILPIESYLSWVQQRMGRKRFYYVPTVFWWNASDRALMSVVAAGTVLSVLLICNVFPPLLLTLLFILHLSVVSAGQDFLSFGWESFLLEITFNTIFLSTSSPPNPLIWLSLNLILFRFHFQAGVSKLLSRDINWRNLTAIYHHYQSQPIPNATAWYVHKLPLWFHKASTALMFFIEIIVPFGIFATQEVRLFVFFCFVGLQLVIWLTGNFSYLNHLTVVLCVLLVSDAYFTAAFGQIFVPGTYSPVFDGISWVVGAILVTLQLISLWDYFLPNFTLRRILSWIQPFHIVNRYGIFAVMTTTRYEIVVEGSDDGDNWKEYTFRYKASELNRRPRRISPYQPRLDWQVWFLPFTSYESEYWFQSFLHRLLQGSREVLKLMRHNPFPEKPPKYIRVLMYEYEFTDAQTKKSQGLWWKRRLVWHYSPTLTLNNRE